MFYISRKHLQSDFIHGFDELVKSDLSSVLDIVVLQSLYQG